MNIIESSSKAHRLAHLAAIVQVADSLCRTSAILSAFACKSLRIDIRAIPQLQSFPTSSHALLALMLHSSPSAKEPESHPTLHMEVVLRGCSTSGCTVPCLADHMDQQLKLTLMSLSIAICCLEQIANLL